MSDQSPHSGIPAIEIPEVAVENPYRKMGSIGMARSDIHDPRAKGFDGDALDSLLRSRFVEGMRLGREEGQESAASRYAAIFDEGYRTAAGTYAMLSRQQLLSMLAPQLRAAQAGFEKIRSSTRSAATKGLCDEAIQTINATFDRL